MKSLHVAMLGCGVVGTEVARRILENGDDLAQRTGARLELTAVAVRDADKERPGIPAELLTTDAQAAIAGADIVIELMGGIEPARELILAALRSGASVVTANKALLAESYGELMQAADSAEVRLEHEAAVAGAIPIIRPVGDSLAGDRITRVMGIVNGTTNYILDQMDSEGWDFDTALRTAQELGFAEADPTADIGGHDAAAKAAILAAIAFHTPVTHRRRRCRGHHRRHRRHDRDRPCAGLHHQAARDLRGARGLARGPGSLRPRVPRAAPARPRAVRRRRRV